jgi:RNA polymerase sigma factor (sigma-70 family)
MLSTEQIYTEQELVTALKKHDNFAFKYLYIHYRVALYNIIIQLVPNTETANDILQEVIIAIWKNIDKYDSGKGRLFTWLHILTRNTTINTIRSKNFKVHSKNENLADVVSTIDKKKGLVQNVDQIGLRKQVHLLRDDYRNVLELSYFNGFTQEEVAKTLNIPVGTVKTRLRNALIELRKQFV